MRSYESPRTPAFARRSSLHEPRPLPVPLPAPDTCACEGNCPHCQGSRADTGRSLPAALQSRFPSRFSAVRIHQGSSAAALTAAHQASALTFGNHIYFSPGAYQPDQVQGQSLLVHEMTHVAQQEQIGARVQCAPPIRDGYPQAQTLGEAKGDYSQMTPFKVPGMDPTIFFEKLPDQIRYKWYLLMLGMYQNQIDESALKHKVPPQLIATIILNELADINAIDLVQEGMGVQTGSIGMAQINVDTAMQDKLVTQPGDEARWEQKAEEAAEEFRKDSLALEGSGLGLVGKDTYYDIFKRTDVAKRLRIPQFAIEAVALELKHLLDEAVLKPNNPWQQKFGFTLTSTSLLQNPNDIYNFVEGGSQLRKEENLAKMIAAAYNSPQIIQAKLKASITPGDDDCIYENATAHGDNASTIAGDLYVTKLFHSFSDYKQPIQIK